MTAKVQVHMCVDELSVQRPTVFYIYFLFCRHDRKISRACKEKKNVHGKLVLVSSGRGGSGAVAPCPARVSRSSVPHGSSRSVKSPSRPPTARRRDRRPG